jgi:hypothetical protein
MISSGSLPGRYHNPIFPFFYCGKGSHFRNYSPPETGNAIEKMNWKTILLRMRPEESKQNEKFGISIFLTE